tara:strand:- start:240 stop:395 length:156 start_codon:yes stop_codon:yes gene_type:complete
VPNITKTDIEACNKPVMQARCEADSAEAEKTGKIFAQVRRRASTGVPGQAE